MICKYIYLMFKERDEIVNSKTVISITFFPIYFFKNPVNVINYFVS